MGLDFEKDSDLDESAQTLDQHDYQTIRMVKTHPDLSDAGHLAKKVIANKKIVYVNPDVTNGIHMNKFTSDMTNPVAQQKVVSRPKYEFTAIPVSGYTNHLKDPMFIERSNANLIGKILELRTTTIRAIEFYAPRLKYHAESYTGQYRWAVENMRSVVTGIQSFKTLPVSVMNHQSLITYIDGIDSVEQANLVHEMSICKKYEVNCIDYPHLHNFIVTCLFDDDENKEFVFGKPKLDRLQPLDEDEMFEFKMLPSDWDKREFDNKKADNDENFEDSTNNDTNEQQAGRVSPLIGMEINARQVNAAPASKQRKCTHNKMKIMSGTKRSYYSKVD